jgi:hypothetical protein
LGFVFYLLVLKHVKKIHCRMLPKMILMLKIN